MTSVEFSRFLELLRQADSAKRHPREDSSASLNIVCMRRTTWSPGELKGVNRVALASDLRNPTSSPPRSPSRTLQCRTGLGDTFTLYHPRLRSCPNRAWSRYRRVTFDDVSCNPMLFRLGLLCVRRTQYEAGEQESGGFFICPWVNQSFTAYLLTPAHQRSNIGSRAMHHHMKLVRGW